MYFPFAKDEAGQKAPYKIEKMKYYLIAGEPSGDLHGANLIRCLLYTSQSPRDCS